MRITLELPEPRFKISDVVQVSDMHVKILGYSMFGGWKWSSDNGMRAWVNEFSNSSTDGNTVDDLEWYYGTEVQAKLTNPDLPTLGTRLSLSMGEVDRTGELVVSHTTERS